jgi:hypothetical protein
MSWPAFGHPLFGESLASFVPAALWTCAGCRRRQSPKARRGCTCSGLYDCEASAILVCRDEVCLCFSARHFFGSSILHHFPSAIPLPLQHFPSPRSFTTSAHHFPSSFPVINSAHHFSSPLPFATSFPPLSFATSFHPAASSSSRLSYPPPQPRAAEGVGSSFSLFASVSPRRGFLFLSLTQYR